MRHAQPEWPPFAAVSSLDGISDCISRQDYSIAMGVTVQCPVEGLFGVSILLTVTVLAIAAGRFASARKHYCAVEGPGGLATTPATTQAALTPAEEYSEGTTPATMTALTPAEGPGWRKKRGFPRSKPWT